MIKTTTVSAIFNVIAGKYGPKPAIWAGLALACLAAAIAVGIAIELGAVPRLSGAFFVASLLVGGISSAINGAGSVSNHRHFAQLTELQEKNLALQMENLKMEQKLLDLVEALQEQRAKERG
jgi:hypothetical protein